MSALVVSVPFDEHQTSPWDRPDNERMAAFTLPPMKSAGVAVSVDGDAARRAYAVEVVEAARQIEAGRAGEVGHRAGAETDRGIVVVRGGGVVVLPLT
jgi:hypothetical protein